MQKTFTTLALVGTLASVGLTQADTIELTGTLRDFKIDHPDMQNENKSFGVKTGLVLSQLGEDGKPLLDTANDPARGMITGPESFDQWYRDVPGVNIAIPLAITLDNGSDEPGGVYSFAKEGSGNYFFPADGLGFNDMQSVSTGTHNFYFTYEINTEFTYYDPNNRDLDGDGIPSSEDEDDGSMVFTFTGDDDVWVYINGKLAVDIGGVHAQESRSVNLDEKAEELGLEPGGVYSLHFFFAERHTTQSNFRIDTTLRLVAIPPTTVSPLYD
ncbi:MAG: fibro-slime domain-containing protein [Planctomycetota bacterium]